MEVLLGAEKARVEHFERDVAAKTDKRQQLLVACQKTNQTASRQLADDGESLQELQSMVATVTAELKKWRKLGTETAEELKIAKEDVVLQLGS